MRATFVLLGVCLQLGLEPATAQPSIERAVNAATLRATPFSFSGLAKGSLAVITGTGFGNSSSALSVTLTTSSGDFPAALVNVSDVRVSFVVPQAAPAGPARLSLTRNGQSTAVPVEIVEANLGVFTATGDGNGTAIVTDTLSGAPITLDSPARPGQYLTVWATGLGPASSQDLFPPQSAEIAADLSAYLGGRPADVLFRGRSSCCGAVDQINIRVPADAPQGCYVPLYFKSARGSYVSNYPLLPVTADGSACRDPLGFASLSITGKDRLVTGLMVQERNFSREANGSISTADFVHQIYTSVARASWANARSDSTLGSIAPGSCVVEQTDNASRADPLNPSVLNAGPSIAFNIGARSFSFPPDGFGGYGAFLRGVSPLDFSGSGTISNGPGAEVPAFNVKHDTPPLPAFQWQEQNTLASLTAGDPLTLTWSGSSAEDFLYISGGSDNPRMNMTFTCRVLGSESAFTVPADVTRLLPRGAGNMSVILRRPIPVQDLPAGLDAFRYERQMVRWRGISIQ